MQTQENVHISFMVSIESNKFCSQISYVWSLYKETSKQSCLHTKISFSNLFVSFPISFFSDILLGDIVERSSYLSTYILIGFIVYITNSTRTLLRLKLLNIKKAP